MKYIFDRITVDYNICNGKPTIRGKRITVQTILEFLSAGDATSEILKQYPSLEEKDIEDSLKFAASMLDRNFTLIPMA